MTASRGRTTRGAHDISEAADHEWGIVALLRSQATAKASLSYRCGFAKASVRSRGTLNTDCQWSVEQVILLSIDVMRNGINDGGSPRGCDLVQEVRTMGSIGEDVVSRCQPFSILKCRSGEQWLQEENGHTRKRATLVIIQTARGGYRAGTIELLGSSTTVSAFFAFQSYSVGA